MRRFLSRRVAATAAGLVALLAALIVGTASVGAAPPSVFTNNGCAVGNYSCLQAAIGYPFNGFYGARFVGYPYYPVAYYPPVVPYGYAPAAPATVTVSATIVSGRVVTVGQQVSATIDGFTAGETVTASVTAPNGQVTQVGSAAAASDGSVTVAITFPSAGTWQVTVHGQTSNKSVVDSYTVQ